MAWQDLSSITVSATSGELRVGAVELPPFDGISVRVTQVGGESPWPYSYGLLWVVNSQGRELGTIRVYGHPEGEVYRLGAGMSSLVGGGVLMFRPRLYNLRWLSALGKSWTLAFEYDRRDPALPADRFPAPGFQTADAKPLRVVSAGSLGRIAF